MDKVTSLDAQVPYEEQKKWAPPNAGDGKAGMNTGGTQKRLGKDVTAQGHRGKLNPDWVEQLMGLEVGTTKFKDGDNRTDRLRLLGNGVVPQTAEKAYRTLFTKLWRN